MLNPFEDDSWSQASLTDAINRMPNPARDVTLDLDWAETGISSKGALIDMKDTGLDMIDAAPYNGVPKQITLTDGTTKIIYVPSHPAQSIVHPQEVAARRAFGTEADTETVEMRQQEHLAFHNKAHMLKWELDRIGALQGKILDRAGNVETDLVALLGHAPTAIGVDFNNANLDWTDFFLNSKDELGEAAQDLMVDGWIVYAPTAQFRVISQSKALKEKYKFFMQANQFADLRAGFPVADGVVLKQYSPNFAIPNSNGRFAFPTDRLIMVPRAAGNYQTRFAPRDSFEYTNTTGVPMYVVPTLMKRGEGLELWSESNHVHFVRRIEAVGLIGQTGTGIWDD